MLSRSSLPDPPSCKTSGGFLPFSLKCSLLMTHPQSYMCTCTHARTANTSTMFDCDREIITHIQTCDCREFFMAAGLAWKIFCIFCCHCCFSHFRYHFFVSIVAHAAKHGWSSQTVAILKRSHSYVGLYHETVS